MNNEEQKQQENPESPELTITYQFWFPSWSYIKTVRKRSGEEIVSPLTLEQYKAETGEEPLIEQAITNVSESLKRFSDLRKALVRDGEGLQDSQAVLKKAIDGLGEKQ